MSISSNHGSLESSTVGLTAPTNRASFPIAYWLAATRAWLNRAEAAHSARSAHETLSDCDLRDTGMAPEDATGAASWQADLPFFMQCGFGRRSE